MAEYGPDEAPTPLTNLADVGRALAKTLRRLETGSIPPQHGAVMVTGYRVLAGIYQDRRDNKSWVRVNELWRQAKDETGLRPETAGH